MDSITITTEEYENLIDARDNASAVETAIPLAFWRKKHGFSQAALATAPGISQPYLAQIQTGIRLGDVNLYAGLAKQLKIRVEDMLECLK